MKITWENLDLGEWKDVSKSHHKKDKRKYLELRLKNINKCVGKIMISEYGCSVMALFSTENDSVHIGYKTKLPENTLKAQWKDLMDKLLDKMFKNNLQV